MVIAHLDDDGKSRALMQEVAEVMENRYDKEKKFLKKGKTDDSEPSPGSSLRKPNLVVSTAQKSDVGISSSSDCDCGIDDDAKKGAKSNDDGDWNRCLFYSKIVARERVFIALMFAVRCAIQSCMRSPPRHIPLQGSTPNFARARVNENGMIWGDLPSNIKVDYFTTPDKTTKSFYLLNDLGRGSNGRAYLICNSTGEACVAKFYLIKDSLAHGGPREYAFERQQWRKSDLEARKKEALVEMEYWKSLYGGKYDVDVRQLRGLWCLLLPYFAPLTDVESRRKSLPHIRHVLEHFKSKKLKYNDNDLWWRHVGIRNGEIALFDLGSLEPGTEGTSIDVDAQMKLLENRINGA